MAIVNGVFHSARVIETDAVTHDGATLFEILFTISGVYASADGGRLQGIPAALATAMKNGQTFALVDAMRGRNGSKVGTWTNVAVITPQLGVKSVSVSGNDALFKLVDASYTAELADGTIPEQNRPLALLAWVRMT